MMRKNFMKKAARVKREIMGTVAGIAGTCYSLAGKAVALAIEEEPKDSAGDVSEITEPLDNLKLLVVSVIGAVGVIILAKNVMEFAQAYQAQDTSTMNSALKGIVAGLMMAGISAVLAFLGF